MSGILYGVGVGPGDPELLTLKAIKIIEKCEVLAIPGKEKEKTYSYTIVEKVLDDISTKECVCLEFPMSRDEEVLLRAHNKAADEVEKLLVGGKSVAFLTIGDPTIYSTFSYLQKIIEERGYETQMVNGVPSFCAVAARKNKSLAKMNEAIHIVPTLDDGLEIDNLSGTKIIMKSAIHMSEMKAKFSECDVYMVSNVGMDNEKIYEGINEIPDELGYLSTAIVHE